MAVAACMLCAAQRRSVRRGRNLDLIAAFEPERFEPDKGRLSRMVIIGDTTPATARVWAHVPGTGRYAVSLSPAKFRGSGQGGDPEGMGGATVGEYLRDQQGASIQLWDFDDPNNLTHCFRFEGLIEDTVYYYILAAELGTDLHGGGRTVVGSATEEYFRTAKSTYGSISFAAYSCHDPYSWAVGVANDGAWPVLATVRDQIDLNIAGGDQVYVDCNEVAMTDLWVLLRKNKRQLHARFYGGGTLDEDGLRDYLSRLIRQYYRIYWNFPSLQSVLGRVPTYMMWDDHEIVDGWGSMNKKEHIAKLTKKHGYTDKDMLLRVFEMTWEAAARVYSEYQHCHNPGPDFTPGDDPREFVWDYTFRRGDYHFFVADMRGHHDCESSRDRLLGAAQHGRLRDWLDGLGRGGTTTTAKAAFVVSPVPVVHWAGVVEYSQIFMSSLKDDLMDAWQHPTNHDERSRLLGALFGASERYGIPIAIVSGDVHCASAYTLTDRVNYPRARILQVTSSSISRKPVGSLGTLAFAKTGFMTRKENDGRGREVKTSVHCRKCFAKAGVCNFAVIGADESDLRVKFYWTGKGKADIQSAAVDIRW